MDLTIQFKNDRHTFMPRIFLSFFTIQPFVKRSCSFYNLTFYCSALSMQIVEQHDGPIKVIEKRLYDGPQLFFICSPDIKRHAGQTEYVYAPSDCFKILSVYHCIRINRILRTAEFKRLMGIAVNDIAYFGNARIDSCKFV